MLDILLDASSHQKSRRQTSTQNLQHMYVQLNILIFGIIKRDLYIGDVRNENESS